MGGGGGEGSLFLPLSLWMLQGKIVSGRKQRYRQMTDTDR